MSYNLEQIDPDHRTGLYVEPSDEEPPSARRWLKTAVALVVMSLFAGGLWFAYVEGARHPGGTSDGDVPLIRADTRPMKVKPAEAGGMHIPDRNMLIYGQGRPEVEHLLPPPELPMALPPPPPATSASAPSSQAAASALPDAAPAASGVQPAPPSVTALPEVAAEPGPASTAAPGGESADLPPTPHPGPAKLPEARSESGKAGGVRLQLASVRSEGMAREEWDRIKRMNPDLLGHLTAVAVRADLGDKGVYYRIQTGPVGDASAAERLCGELRQRHLGCIMVR